MELTGPWRAAIADEHLRRSWHEADFDDGGWEDVAVPGHWRSTPAFAGSDGPVLYRRAFEAGLTGPDRRAWLTFEGCFYQGDAWLDGAYLGDTEGYFAPHCFEVTDALAARSEHHLAIEVTCAPQPDKAAKRNITGVFQHGEGIDPAWNPGGLWRPVTLTETGPVRISRLRVLCREATADRAVVSLRAGLDSAGARTVTISTRLGDVDHETVQPLADGANDVEWTVTVDDPVLWWPRALGSPALHDLHVAVRLPDDEGATISDERRLRTGLREVRLRAWVMAVNGERLFLKGSNHGPTRAALAEATPEEVAGDVALAVDAGLDLLRVHAHIARPELYDAADEAGLLLWQDLPLQRGYARGIRKQAVRQAAQAVDLLGHHPSVALWCGHNEPVAVDDEPSRWAGPRVRRRRRLRALAAQELPTWNKTVLDRAVKRAFEQHDGTRPVIAHSGVLPHPPLLDGTDSHLYFGWYHGHERDLAGFVRAVPRMARFVSELGAQAVPTTAAFMEPERWPDLDWARLADGHGLQRALFDRHVPPADHDSFEAWRAATQAYQAELVRRQIEVLRRIKYRPTGGFAHFCLADSQPAVSFSVLDHERVPKAGYEAVKAACAPVIVVADRPPAVVAPGTALALDVHVVSDLRQPLDDGVVSARLGWAGGERTWRFTGAVGADDCQRVGTLQVVVPEAAGELVLDLELRHPRARATNRYVATIAPA